jgi:cytochrome P450
VLVAATGAVAPAMAAARERAIDHLVVVGTAPTSAVAVDVPVTVVLAAPQSHGDLVEQWQRAVSGPLTIKVLPTGIAGLLRADSPVPPALLDRLMLGEGFSAERAGGHGDGRPMFPVPRASPYAPPAEYAGPGGTFPRSVRLAYGGTAWLVAGYRDARVILADPTFSSDSTLPQYPSFPLASKRRVPGHFLSMDDPEHTRLRRVVAADFSASSLRRLRPALRSRCAGLVDAVVRAGQPADLIDLLAVPLPALVAAELLGVPAEDRPVFQAAARDLQVHEASAARRAAAGGRMNRYLAQLVEAKRESDGSDLLGRLARLPADERGLTDEELVGVANLILVAGLETTAGLLGLTVLSLLRDRAQGDLVRTDPGRWAEQAVREALRYWTVVHHGVARVATRDVVVSGRLIRAGDAVVVHLPTANRDPAVFADGAVFDIVRDAPGHLAFGHGAHRCLGAALAQFQASAAVEALFERLPGLRLANDTTEPEFRHDMLVYGLRSLVVAW